MIIGSLVRVLLIVFGIAVLIPAVSAEPGSNLAYAAEAIEGWVVDADSGLPLAGVVVLADWSLEGGEVSNPLGGELMLLETATTQDGRYYFPAWGPLTVARPDVYLWNNDPMLFFLKSGYRTVGKSNGVARGWDRVREPLRSSRWNGKQIQMQSYRNNEAMAAKELSQVDIERMIFSGEDCEWKQMPLTVAFLLRESSRLKELGQKVVPPNPVSFAHQDRCGSAQAWISTLPK